MTCNNSRHSASRTSPCTRQSQRFVAPGSRSPCLRREKCRIRRGVVPITKLGGALGQGCLCCLLGRSIGLCLVHHVFDRRRGKQFCTGRWNAICQSTQCQAEPSRDNKPPRPTACMSHGAISLISIGPARRDWASAQGREIYRKPAFSIRK